MLYNVLGEENAISSIDQSNLSTVYDKEGPIALCNFYAKCHNIELRTQKKFRCLHANNKGTDQPAHELAAEIV